MGMALTVSAGQTINNVVLPMIASPTISGHTFFPNGEPLAAAVVQAYRWRYTPFGPRMKIVRTALTDDAGEYRLFWLGFGNYVVSASYSHRAQRATLNGVRLSPNVPDPDEGYATTFYGGTTNAAEAQTVRVAPGFDEGGVNINLSDVPRFKIQGRVVSAAALPPDLKIVFVEEGTDLVLDDAGYFISPGPEGSFEVRGVSHQANSVSAMSFLVLTSSPRLRLQERNLRDSLASGFPASQTFSSLSVLSPGLQVHGRLIGGSDPLSDFRRSEVALTSVESGFPSPGKVSPQADGQFAITDVFPGEYLLSISGLPEDTYMKAARQGATDVLETVVTIRPESPAPLQILIGSDGGRISATVFDRENRPFSGAQVVLVPDGARLHRNLRHHFLLCGATNPGNRRGRASRKYCEATLLSAAGVVPQPFHFGSGTTPSAPFRNGTFFLMAQPPLLT
jgi:hypothetical protein